MCGRFFLGDSAEIREIQKLLEKIIKNPEDFPKQGEIRPTDETAVFRWGDSRLKLDLMRWGYNVDFRKGPLINAKSETVREKALFARDFYIGRCLIPTSGFYEWDEAKKKYFFAPKEGLLYLGGIYRWEREGYRYVILTRPAVGRAAEIHHRMPVLIPKEKALGWLRDPEVAEGLLKEEFLNLNIQPEERG